MLELLIGGGIGLAMTLIMWYILTKLLWPR